MFTSVMIGLLASTAAQAQPYDTPDANEDRLRRDLEGRRAAGSDWKRSQRQADRSSRDSSVDPSAAQIAPEVRAAVAAAATPAAYQETAQPGDPACWRTDQFNADWGLGAIGAGYAYARGLTGAGVALGQFDSGVELTHPEFAERDHVSVHLLSSGCAPASGSRIVFDWQTGCVDTHGNVPTIDVELVYPNTGADYSYYRYGSHGTHVAGTMVASRDGSGMHGVSFGSRLVTARFFADNMFQWTQAPDGSWRRDYIAHSSYANNAENVHQLYDQLAANGARAR